ncbi:MAG: DMT family transporter [Pseudomonadota bacterium]
MAHTEAHHRTVGIASILFAVLVWVGWTVSSSYSVRAGLTAYDLTALRFGTAGLVMLPVAWRKGLRVGPWGIWGGLALAATMGATYNTITVSGMRFAPTSHASGIIINTMLVLTTAGAVLFLKERTSTLRIGGIAISLAGIACLLYAQGPGDSTPANLMIGHSLFLIGGTIWALHALCIKAWKADPIHVTAVVCVISAVIYMPIYYFFLPSGIGPHNYTEAAVQAVYQGIINSVCATFCFNRAIRLIGASTTSAFLPLIPVLATLVAIPVMNEMPTPIEWLGLGLAAIGVLLATGFLERWIIRHTPHL